MPANVASILREESMIEPIQAKALKLFYAIQPCLLCANFLQIQTIQSKSWKKQPPSGNRRYVSYTVLFSYFGLFFSAVTSCFARKTFSVCICRPGWLVKCGLNYNVDQSTRDDDDIFRLFALHESTYSLAGKRLLLGFLLTNPSRDNDTITHFPVHLDN